MAAAEAAANHNPDDRASGSSSIAMILDWLRDHRGQRILARTDINPQLGVPEQPATGGRIGPEEPWTDVRLGHLEARYTRIDRGYWCAPVIYDGRIIDATQFRLGVAVPWGEQWLFAIDHEEVVA
jgi:hypothetical protein